MSKSRSKSDPKPDWQFATRAVHAGNSGDHTHGGRNVPIFQTVSYHFKDADDAGDLFGLKKAGNVYSRLTNPTVTALEEKVAMLEGGTGAAAASSGLAAQFITLFALMNSGDEFISSRKIYGGSSSEFFYSFKKFGWTVKFADPENPDSFKKALSKKTKAIFVESASNPGGIIPDFDALAKIAREAQVPLIVDNTVPTPALFQPLKHGANIVVYSLTKYMSGHSTSMGGMAVDGGNFDWLKAKKHPSLYKDDESYQGLNFAKTFGKAAFATHLHAVGLRDFGSCLSPMNAFLIMTGMETLPLRMKKHVENADAVAEFLSRHNDVSWVSYPRLKGHVSYQNAKKYMPEGCGALFTFGLKKPAAGAILAQQCNIFRHMAHLGDTGSLMIHPASTTHRQLTAEQKKKAGCTDDVVRISVGLEDINDLLADLDQALRKAKAKA